LRHYIPIVLDGKQKQHFLMSRCKVEDFAVGSKDCSLCAQSDINKEGRPHSHHQPGYDALERRRSGITGNR
jgi:hypothetical protein